MAKGDVRPTASRYRGGRYGGGGSSYYDDEGRGESKNLWIWFKENFEANPTRDWLLSLDNHKCYELIKNSTLRNGLMDISYSWSPGWRPDDDTRAHRLVIHRLSEAIWGDFHKHLVDGYNAEKDRREKIEHQRAEEWQGKHAAYEAQREAEAAVIKREDWLKVSEVMEITSGMLSSELNQVFVTKDKIGSSGEWIEDMVDVYQEGEGWGTETEKAKGIKLQVTLSLDLSNSMHYNGVDKIAAGAFRDLGMTLRMLQCQYPDDLFVSYYTFSEDSYGEHGKMVRRLYEKSWEKKDPNVETFGIFEPYRPSLVERSYGGVAFDGTDTFIAPLFSEIEKWEKEESDPGCVRLDIILTDAVLEHKKDIREADVVQERRDGQLQSVLLNFMPEHEWLGSTLPKRCFMIKVDKDNIAGMLRNVLSEFVGAQL